MNKWVIFILIGFILSGCPAKKEVEQPKIITSMQELQEDVGIQKQQILKKVDDYIEKKDYEKAVLELNKAIDLDQTDASLYYTLGDLYEQLGKDKESVEAFVKALQLDKEKKTENKGQRPDT
ncbi:MAG: tetratricopeptide repeat protein [bacterium]